MPKIKTEEMIAFLKEKWSNKKCPMCNHSEWGVQVSVFELREFQGGDLTIGGGPIIPIIPIVCGNCGNTILVNAIKAGAVEPQGEKSDG